MAGIISAAQTPIATASQTPVPSTNVANWYRTTLGRDPDQAGLDYWNKRLSSGGDANALYGEFTKDAQGNGEVVNHGATSQTANTYTGPQSASQSTNTPVDEWGQNVLGRPLTAAEQQRYSSMLDGTAQGAQTAYSQFMNDNAGSVKNNLTWAQASQLSQPQQNQPLQTSGAQPLTASTYQPTLLGNPTQWNVAPNQTVEGIIAGIIGSDNPLMQQARTQALQQANSREILNSTMAVEAGQNAVYGAAMPIASADAATAAKAAGYNADESNQFSVANQNAQNTAGQFNSAARNTLTGQQLAANTQLATANISANTQRYVSDQSEATQLAVSKMSTQSQQLISQLHDTNSVLLQNNQSAQQAYSNYVNAVANIDIQNTMDAAAKTSAIQTQTQIFNNAISGLRGATSGTPDVSSPLNIGGSNASVAQAVNAVSGVDVSHILNFGEGGTG